MACVGDALYEELWRACAGPLVEVPRAGERVFYFPQGHLEQLEGSTDEELNQQIPVFDLPSKILCRVINVGRMAEPETDEIYAQITLLAEPDASSKQNEPASPDPFVPETPRPVIHSFCKILTASDTSTHDGFSVLHRHATQCLPSLDMSGEAPAQELVARDLHGLELSTTGWRTFVASKKLVSGDALILMRGENDELLVGVRRPTCCQKSKPFPTNEGVLDTVSRAVSTGTFFTVHYKPSSSQFIVSANKYLEATKNGFAVGMRFKMRLEGEDFSEESFTGSIIGIGDVSSEWPGSEWRSLKVQWDEASSILRPERISPWDVEPLGHPMPTSSDPQAVRGCLQ